MNLSLFTQPDSSSNASLAGLQAQIYQESRNKPRPYRQLMAWLIDRRNLDAAWGRVRSAEGANTPGLDGITCNDVRPRVQSWLSELADDLLHRNYRPQPPRWVDVPKKNSPDETRRLGILSVRDRVLHAALKQLFEPILDPVFLAQSFGFRPRRSVAGALEYALRSLSAARDRPHFRYGYQLDVVDCFPSIDHDVLRAEMGKHIADPEIVYIVDSLLAAGGTATGHMWWQRRRGIIQGSALSPLLCNLYLHPLDLALQELGKAAKNGVRLLRYADDLLLLASDEKTAERGLALVRQVLKRLHLRLHFLSVSPVPVVNGLQWLGVRLQPRRQGWTDQQAFGYVIPDAKVADMIQRLSAMTEPPNAKIDSAAFILSKWIVSLNNQLRDWRQAYVFADNCHEVFRALDDHVRERVAELLHSITGLRRAEVYKQYKVHLPRGYWTWQVPGARLTVLSSLAPHAPANLIRKPKWMINRPTTIQTTAGIRRPKQAKASLSPRLIAGVPATPTNDAEASSSKKQPENATTAKTEKEVS